MTRREWAEKVLGATGVFGIAGTDAQVVGPDDRLVLTVPSRTEDGYDIELDKESIIEELERAGIDCKKVVLCQGMTAVVVPANCIKG